jgi:hypothetical protein
MKNSTIPVLSAAVAALFAAGCASDSTYDKGPYVPEQSKTPYVEGKEAIVLLDPAVRYSVTSPAYMARTLDDGRIEVTVHLRNRENRRIEVQANCVFKDLNGDSTGDETPFQTVILTENATEQVKFVSSNNQAKRYTVRVRQAH